MLLWVHKYLYNYRVQLFRKDTRNYLNFLAPRSSKTEVGYFANNKIIKTNETSRSRRVQTDLIVNRGKVSVDVCGHSTDCDFMTDFLIIYNFIYFA